MLTVSCSKCTCSNKLSILHPIHLAGVPKAVGRTQKTQNDERSHKQLQLCMQAVNHDHSHTCCCGTSR